MSVSPSPRIYGPPILGRYEVRRKLGSGSLGTVYLARDLVAGREVALKLIRAEHALAAALLSMQQEFQAITALRHPQIARAYDFGYTEPDRIPFYTREYVEGAPLLPGPPSGEEPAEFLRPIIDVLEALEYVHEHGVLHLDIHPGNVIVADDPRRGSVLIDFGLIGSLKHPAAALSRNSWPVLPPELFEARSLTPAADLYLAGRLLFYRLTGRRGGRPVLPREIPGWGTRLTLELERIVVKALQHRPEERFPSAAAFRSALLKTLGRADRRSRKVEPHETILGRDSELAAIDAALEEAVSGRPGILWFVSKPGMGKSRLLEAARLRCQLRGLFPVKVQFSSDPGPEPALLRALRQARRERRLALEWIETLAPSLGGTPAERAQRAAEAYFRGPECPLVLLLDDLEFADHESHLLAEALLAESLRRREECLQGRGIGLILSSAGAPGLAKGHSREAVRNVVRVLKPLQAPEAKRLFLSLLGPVAPDRRIVRKVLAKARGSPFYIRHLALWLRTEWREEGAVPATAELPETLPETAETGAGHWEKRLAPQERGILQALAVLARPVTEEELAASIGSAPRSLRRSVRRLLALELIRRAGGKPRRYHLALTPASSGLLSALSEEEIRRLHKRIARYLAGRNRSTTLDRENLARHLLAAGESETGARAALDAADRLRKRRAHDRAVRLLEEAILRVKSRRRRLQLAEAASAILEETGDHQKGLLILGPIYKSEGEKMTRAQRVRIGRRLAVHYHRAGSPREALALFREIQDLAHPVRHLTELIHIDSELAELSIFRGAYEAAEEACVRGLRRVEKLRGQENFRGRMEVMLRASLGHIELRRLAIPRARRELKRALELSRRFGTMGDRAAILHNLGVIENHASNFSQARRYFREAERLLLRAGERQNLIKVSTNLALIAAKLGDRDAARLHLERVSGLLRHHPGLRLECFAAYSRGLVSYLFGECDVALGALEDAVRKARELGDLSLEFFGKAYLAETCLLMGRYRKALAILNPLAKELKGTRGAPPALERTVSSRLYFLEAILGRKAQASKALERLGELPRTDVLYLEAWNDLFVGLGRLAAGEKPIAFLNEALAAFQKLRIPIGERLARLALAVQALREEDKDRLGAILEESEASGRLPHRFLEVVEPVLHGEAAFLRGDLGKAEEWINVASSAIVGSPFLEVDWRLELLRARVAMKKGERNDARRHLHRAIHGRDLLAGSVPPGTKKRFFTHPRFALLRDLEERLSIGVAREASTPRLPALRSFEAMVGRSAAMVSVYKAIERLRDIEAPVLITGETGTGKELVAKAIHARSLRAGGSFNAVHCACLPPELFESELFGHVAGAFSGADRDQPGLLEIADGGTVLLDEVSQLPLESQAKLLRVLQSGSIRKLGSVSPQHVDVRFLVTTSSDLVAAVAAGRFRKDLYYRISAVEIHVPALRERKEDIPLLARHFLEEHARRLDQPVATLEPDALRLLEKHDWPGNVRELEGVLLRALLGLSHGERITARHLEPLLHQAYPPQRSLYWAATGLLDRSLSEWRRELEREYLTRLFFTLRGETKEMMRRLGVKSTKFYAWLRELGLDVRELRRRL